MALFSRREKRTDDAPVSSEDESAAASALTDQPPVAEAPLPAVGISVSTFGGLGAAVPTSPPPLDVRAPEERVAAPAPAAASRPAVAPPPTETVPGLRDNVLLREALATLPAEPTSQLLLNAARQMLQGHLFLRVKGDARALIAEGKELPLAVVRDGDAQWVLAFSSGAALQRSVQADGETDTSAMGQPVLVVMSHVLAGDYAGLVIDPASEPARLTLPRELLQRMVAEADPALRIKTLLAGPRTDDTAAEVGRAMADVPKMFVAVNRAQPDAGGEERMGVAETRDAEGNRILELYTHPLEVLAMGRNDQPMPFTPAQVAGALTQYPELTGIVVDAGGPWIRLTRDDLAPVLALTAE